jgi:large subunit ribosomal protein L3
MKGIIGKKLDMTQLYGANGSVIPVTALAVGPCVVVQVKTADTDGYTAIQLGFGEKKNIKKPLIGHVKGAWNGKEGRGFLALREIRTSVDEGVQKGDRVAIDIFSVGEKTDVTAWSKGRGFAGVVKRHHFHGHPPTHGHKDQERMPGAIGSGGVQRVFKGLRMAGRMGNERVTVKNLEIIKIDKEKGILYVKGAVPGARNGIVLVQADGDMKWIKSTKLAQEHNLEQQNVLEQPENISQQEETQE